MTRRKRLGTPLIFECAWHKKYWRTRRYDILVDLPRWVNRQSFITYAKRRHLVTHGICDQCRNIFAKEAKDLLKKLRGNPPRRRRNSLVEKLICDFCHQRPVAWSYPCEDFPYPLPPVPAAMLRDIPFREASTGAWAACAPCHTMIQDNDWRGVERRWERSVEAKGMVTILRQLLDISRDDARARIAAWAHEQWRRFRVHRTGDPVRVLGPRG